MALQVFVSRRLADEARRFVDTLRIDSVISPLSAVNDRSVPVRTCLLYFSGLEESPQVERPLETLAQRRSRLKRVIVYARHPDARRVVHWARVVERVLPKQTEFCFSPIEVARALNVRLQPRQRKTETHAAAADIDVEALRTALALTQAQLASAIGVSERTVQNWEAGRLSSRASNRLRDLLELRQILEKYLERDALRPWLIAPNDSLGGDAPQDWILDGKTRDVIWEFRRLQLGEPA